MDDNLRFGLDTGERPRRRGQRFCSFFNVLANTTAQRRTGTIFVAGQLFTVRQAAASQNYGCRTGNTIDFDAVRTEGLTESLEDLKITCFGTPPAGDATGDILVTYNATITSKLTGPAADDIDVWLILNETTNPTPGVTAFRGKLAGPTTVKFQNVPLWNVVNVNPTFRIVNVRVNANSLLPFQTFIPVVAAVVQIHSTRFIPITGNYTFLGFPGFSFSTTVSGATSVGTTHQMLPVTFTEADTVNFRPKEKPAGSDPEFRFAAESLFKHPNLGAQTGQADTGTRLRLRIPVAAGVRVWAPTTLLGNVDARLMSSDETGLGGSVVTGSALFGGMYQELTPVNGFATAVWEVFAADAALRESATAQLVFQGGSMTTVTREHCILLRSHEHHQVLPTRPRPSRVFLTRWQRRVSSTCALPPASRLSVHPRAARSPSGRSSARTSGSAMRSQTTAQIRQRTS